MLLRSRIMALVMVAAALAGCGVRPVTGGTKGVLRCAGKLLSDIQVTVYQVDGSSTQPIGFGVTTNDGSFRLVKNNASGALALPRRISLHTRIGRHADSACERIRSSRHHAAEDLLVCQRQQLGSRSSGFARPLAVHAVEHRSN